jgi:molybdopterin-binding protein
MAPLSQTVMPPQVFKKKYNPPMTLLKLPEAAELLNISYPTIKQWIYKGRIQSVRGPGGHHRIPQSEIDRLTLVKAANRKSKPGVLQTISGRNKLLGTVESVRHSGLLAEVKLNVSGQIITAIITSQSCKDLGLKRGVEAYALMKSTEVMVVRP